MAMGKRRRRPKKTSMWVDAKIAKMKDGRTHPVHKAEFATPVE